MHASHTLVAVAAIAGLLFAPACAQTSVQVVTVAAPLPTNEPTYIDDGAFKAEALNSTNLYRYEHNASAVAWNTSLADYARNWISSCKYGHSGGPSGENIAQGFSNLSLAVDTWGDERALYDWSAPGYSEATGHFTQLVWRATRTMGCARILCGSSGWYVSCNYWPAGNVILNGKFEADQVGSQINKGAGYSYVNGSQGLNSGDAGGANSSAADGSGDAGGSDGSGSGSGQSVGVRTRVDLLGALGVVLATIWLTI